MQRRDDYATVVTIALLLLLRSLAVALGGPNQYRPESDLPVVWIGPLPQEGARVAASVCALLALGVFWIVIKKTWVGLALRAAAQNRVAVQTSGVDVYRLDAVAFAIGVALAGLAGALLAPLFMVFPTNGAVTTVKGFEIIVIGGLGSIPGALVGGLLLGLVESLGRRLHLLALSERLRLSARDPGAHRPARTACSASAGGRRDGPAALLEAEGLTKRYGGLVANNAVSMTLAKGEVRGLIGPNGAGKTTFVNLLTGIETPDAGASVSRGTDLTGLDLNQIARAGSCAPSRSRACSPT